MNNFIGVVIWTDRQRGMFKVKCNNNRVALVEILDSIDIELQDTISGALMNYGEDVTLYSEENSSSFTALIQDLD